MELSQKEFEELFTLKEYLGEGTFGFVNTALCHSNGLKYAVKQILMPRDLNHLQRVLKESISREILLTIAYFLTGYFLNRKE